MSKITLCGSYDDREKIYEVGRILLETNEVYTPSFFLGRRPCAEEQVNLMNAHFSRIEISEKVLFIFDTKFGTNTLLELGYALAHNLSIYVLIGKDLKAPNELYNHPAINFKHSMVFSEGDLVNWINR